MKSSATIEISRPIDDVFAYISDPKNMEQWVVGVSDVRLSGDDPAAVGTRFTSDYTYGGKTHAMSYEVTGVEEPTRYAIRGEGPFPFDGELTLEATPTGTRVTNTIDAASDGLFTSVLFAVAAPVMRRVMAKRLREELVALDEAMESTAASPAAA